MKPVLKNMILSLAAIGVIILFSACFDLRLSSGSSETSATADNFEIDRDIVLVNTYENYAEGWQYCGCYIDKDGYKHSFDIAEDNNFQKDDLKDINIEKLVDMLENGYAAENKEEAVSKNILEKCYRNMKKIVNFEFDEEHSHGCDMGESTLYGIVKDENSERVIIPIVQYGDWVRRNTDKYAVEAAKILGIKSYDDNLYHGLIDFE